MYPLERMATHLQRIVAKEMPLFLQWLYRLRVIENTDDTLIGQVLSFYSQMLEGDPVVQRSHTLPNRPWQHSYWAILHATGFYLTELGRKDMTIAFAKLMLRFDELLPCSICKGHYASQKMNVSWQLYAGVDPGLVIIQLHNTVASHTGKPLYTIRQVCDLYGVPTEGRNNTPAFDYASYVQVLNEVEQSKQWTIATSQLVP